jgi:hypothetical protein
VNELISWKKLDLKETSTKKFFSIIRSLDENVHPELSVKWKDYEHQLVIGTKDYFYKVYTIDRHSGRFFEKIREKLAEIYREVFNIHWYVKTIENDGILYQVEQREILKVCSPEDLSFEELLLNWGKTLKILESKLKLKLIIKQIQETYPDVYDLKVIRDCINKFSDYAINRNNDIVLLDDSDWFLAMVDKDGNWLSKKPIIKNTISLVGESYFAPLEIEPQNVPIKTILNEDITKWNIFTNEANLPSLDLLESNEKRMLKENIKLLSTGKIEKLSLIDYKN